MSPADLLGLVAASLTTVAFVPQVWHTWKSRSGAGISLLMISLFALGVFLWLLYGLALGALPIILANGITLVLALALVVMKLRFRP